MEFKTTKKAIYLSFSLLLVLHCLKQKVTYYIDMEECVQVFLQNKL